MSIVQVKANVKMDNTGKVLSLPCLIIQEKGLLDSHLRYLVKHRSKSVSWKEQSTLAVRLFLEYCNAHEFQVEHIQELFLEFSESLFLGTCNQRGDDPSELRWKPKSSSTASSLINHLTRYSDYLYDQSNGESVLLNPLVEASHEQRMLNLAAYHHKKNRSFFKHTFNKNSVSSRIAVSRMVRTNDSGQPLEDANAFPNDVAIELITKGFELKGASLNFQLHEGQNLKNILITMLLQYGGLRVSEPFHLFVDDILSDPDNPDSALIRVQHPATGAAPDWFREKSKAFTKANRKQFLSTQFGIEDRLSSTKHSYHSGWKNSRINNFYVYWWPTHIGEVWMHLWRLYLKYQRVATKPADHPFAFTNQYGEPASLFVFKRAHRNAIKSLGYTPSSNTGLNPHGHRHWYCQSLTDNKVDPLIIKKAMHHASVESQIRYQEFSDSKIRKELGRLETSLTFNIQRKNKPLESGFDDVDPLGWFSGQMPIFAGK